MSDHSLDDLRSKHSGYSHRDSNDSDKSHHSSSTAPTEYTYSSRPPVVHHDTCDGRLEDLRHKRCISYEVHSSEAYDPRSSAETYASTEPSESEFEYDEPEYTQPQLRSDLYPSEIKPATPRDFSELFPSSNKLYIKHDDSTPDGNMNLRIDTLVKLSGGRSQELGMFHLRMHNLKTREFSLRRYHRDSGKEVCHSAQKPARPVAARRPSLQRSISSALASFLPRHSATSSMKRADSGYGSIYSPSNVAFDQQAEITGTESKSRSLIPTKTTRLEFSNYAQVDVKRQGAKGNKRYEFEYWGTKYVWKRLVYQTSSSEAVSYHLRRAGDERILAHIEPSPMSGCEIHQERLKGGWIPPCEMWINDKHILSDRNEEAE